MEKRLDFCKRDCLHNDGLKSKRAVIVKNDLYNEPISLTKPPDLSAV
jgi:hypothetical protein